MTDLPTRVLLFTGKGGVGKTTTAAKLGAVLAAGGHETGGGVPAHGVG